jgi:hypothetical protein
LLKKDGIMKQNTKDWLQHISAVALIASAITLAFVSFLTTHDIGAGPLTYIGEALSAALGLFGISIYVVNKVGEMKNEIRKELSAFRKETERGGDEE